jgi:hypothetical protein
MLKVQTLRLLNPRLEFDHSQCLLRRSQPVKKSDFAPSPSGRHAAQFL